MRLTVILEYGNAVGLHSDYDHWMAEIANSVGWMNNSIKTAQNGILGLRRSLSENDTDSRSRIKRACLRKEPY